MTRFNNYDLPGMPPVLAWNPIVMRCPGGCEVGDEHCWHLRMANRHASNPGFPDWFRRCRAGEQAPTWHANEHTAPLKRRNPAVIATMFMGDIGRLPEHIMLRRLALTAAAAQRHAFLILTKYPQALAGIPWPENCWVGVSVCTQEGADERLPVLMGLDCQHRWVSVEPMLGPVDLRPGAFAAGSFSGMDGIEFVAAGPETGPLARPFHPAWIDEEYDGLGVQWQCRRAGVPFYDKRAGGAREWPEEWKTAVGGAR